MDVRLDPDGNDAQLLASSLHGGEAVAVLAIVVVDVHVRLRPDGSSARGPLTVHALRHVDRVLDREDPLLHVVADEVDRVSHLCPLNHGSRRTAERGAAPSHIIGVPVVQRPIRLRHRCPLEASMLFLNNDDIQQVLTMKDTLAVLEEGHLEMARQELVANLTSRMG